MSAYITNKAKFRALSCYLAGGTVPSGLEAMLLGGTTASHTFTVDEVEDLNSVADLLALTNVVELVASGYARTALASIAVTEDDTNDRAGADASDIAFGAISAGDTIKGFAIFETGASDAARNLIMVVDALNLPTNGSAITATIADFVRAL